MNNRVFISILLIFSLHLIYGQNIDSTSFDFWIGEWDLEWDDGESKKGYGTNHIYKILNDNVIYENFRAAEGKFKGFEGKSYSVYNKRSGEWKQTWVDNSGGYLDFHGVIDRRTKIFQREFKNPSGKIILQRMVFKNIKTNSLTWNWENSIDGGKTWKLNWQINYKRKASK